MEDDNDMEIEVMFDLEPIVDMVFDSEDAAQQFYAMYAKKTGFGAVVLNSKSKNGIKHWVNLGCFRGGLPRKVEDISTTQPTTKTGCKASMKISKLFDNKWKVNSIHLEHNHEMDPEKSKYLRCYRKIPSHVQREVELNCEAGIKMNQTITAMERSRDLDNDNNTWVLEKDLRNHMDAIRRHNFKGGDAQAMMQYFQRMQANNKDFFYSIDVDENKCLTKVFWADARSREAYKEFGDVVTFDTTYLVNTYDMPFAPFVGVNHHGQSILFGCGLVTKEDTDSFIWLFEAWLACMSGIPTNATDQDRAMQNAISYVFPHARHRWCLWHIMKKVPKKYKAYKNYEQILASVNYVVYDSMLIKDFEENWAYLIKVLELEDDDWLQSMYDERKRWVPAFVKDTFWAGMSTTQRSESINAFFDGYVHKKTTLSEFALQYENALRKKVEKEEHADFKSMNSQYPNMSPYPFEHHFHKVYTQKKFKIFRKQVNQLIGCQINEIGPVSDGKEHFIVGHTFEVGTTNKFTKTDNFVVLFNEETQETCCNCRMFETKGIVCAHMLQIWKWKKVSIVPECYILRRWRKDVVRGHTKVRLSYTKGQKNPEWSRFDVLRALFNEAADGVISSEVLTEKFKEILQLVIEQNKQVPTYVPSFVPRSINVRLNCQDLASQSIHIGDPSRGSKRGRPK